MLFLTQDGKGFLDAGVLSGCFISPHLIRNRGLDLT